jgi:hypothetical protein
MYEARCDARPSSSNVRLILERPMADPASLIAIDLGPRVAWVAGMGLESGGVRIGADVNGMGVVRVGVGVLDVLGELDADTCEVWGSLGPLLKGLSSHDGASLARELRVAERWAFKDVADIVERKE